MITEDVFRKTEGRLYRYYRQQKEIQKLEYKCLILEEQKEKIRKDLHETNIIIEEESRSVAFEERVQTSSSGEGYAEREMIRQIGKLEQEWKELRKYILKLHAKIREYKKQVTDVEYAINLLQPQYRRLIELKYRDGVSLERIGNELHMEKSTASDWRDRVVKDIAKVLDIRL